LEVFTSFLMELVGDPFPVAEAVAVRSGFGAAAVSVSAAGLVAYRTGAGSGNRRLAWFNRSGEEIGPGGPTERESSGPELSPDARRVAVQSANELWILESARGVASRFTFHPALDGAPIWSPDGSRLVFFSNRSGDPVLYQKLASRAGPEEQLPGSSGIPLNWSRDGRFILYFALAPQSGYDLWALPALPGGGQRKSFPLANSSFEERDGQFSPDGRFMAYSSNESGQFEVYLQAFQRSGGKSLVSTEGGTQPRWRGDGRELFYIAADGKLMAVPLRPADDGQSLEAGTPLPLFSARLEGGLNAVHASHQYAVSPDGQRFLINLPTEPAVTSPITLIMNWKPEKR